MPAFTTDHLAVVSIRTNDIPQTVHFYQDIIGLNRLAHHGHQPAFDLGNGLFLVIAKGQVQSQPAVQHRQFPVLAFAVSNLDEAVAHLSRHHIEMPWGVERNPQNRWVEFYDPGGNLIEFAQFGA